MHKIKRMILCNIPTTVCNLRCHYCYLGQRPVTFEREQANFIYSPDFVGKAFSKERLGGVCFFNFCAAGETLLTNRIEEYFRAIIEQGHYIEIVTNMTISPVIDKILSWDVELLKRTEFKCSFHYLELAKNGLLNIFVENVKKTWAAGASASIEITPPDDLIPHIDDIIVFSMKHFGALPQLTIARNDATDGIEYLTELPLAEHEAVWSRFASPFWRFKRSIFKVKRTEFCYAGMYSLFVDMATGKTGQCYISNYHQNVFKNLSKPIKFIPIGKCQQPHCYNGHAFLTMGNIPGKFTDVRFGTDIRDRMRVDGTHWLDDDLRSFFDGRCDENNSLLSKLQKVYYLLLNLTYLIANKFVYMVRKLLLKIISLPKTREL